MEDSKLLFGVDEVDVIRRIDSGIEHQQNWRRLPYGIVIVHVRRSRIDFYVQLLTHIGRRYEPPLPGTLRHIPANR